MRYPLALEKIAAQTFNAAPGCSVVEMEPVKLRVRRVRWATVLRAKKTPSANRISFAIPVDNVDVRKVWLRMKHASPQRTAELSWSVAMRVCVQSMVKKEQQQTATIALVKRTVALV